MNYSKLKPCPFCGFEPDLEDEDTCYPATRDKSVWGVHCTCGSGGCGASVLGDSKIEAIQIWNTRVDPYAKLQESELNDCERIFKFCLWAGIATGIAAVVSSLF